MKTISLNIGEFDANVAEFVDREGPVRVEIKYTTAPELLARLQQAGAEGVIRQTSRLVPVMRALQHKRTATTEELEWSAFERGRVWAPVDAA